MAFDAFISYSHAADGKLAPALQRGLQRLAKPWSRRQALRVFRDDTGLSVNPALWQSITAALDDSAYFILLASPGAAQSEWVNQEISYWMASRPDAAARMLPVVTAGTWVWNGTTGDMDWAASTAAPAALAGVFTGEPRHLDLAWAHSEEDLDLRNTRFRAAVADLAAPIHGIPKDELESEDVLQHRKAVLLRRAAVAALLLLVFGLGIAGLLAFRSAETARGALRDLEDANGNIDDLSAEGARLAAANEQAVADLAETEAARDDAEELAGQAREEAAAAVEAREQADVARESAEGAQAAAEEEQREAEAARSAAEEAQAVAEQGRGAAESAAADAARAEAEARRLEEQARAGELTALDARAAAEEASMAARTAEAAARADEEAALAAVEEAVQQEAEARSAEAAAQAGERVARAAEAEAAAAEAVATAAAEAAAAAAALAEEAAAAAEQRRGEAEAAAQAASLARAATTQSDPALNALLSVESYCAIAPCGAAGQPQRPGTISSMSAQVPNDTYDPATLDPFVPMIDAVSRHQDLVKVLPGWTGRLVDVAVSGDGTVIGALGENGTVRVWYPAAPGGADLGEPNTIGIAVSDDGSRIAGVRSLSSGGATFWMRDLTGTFRTEVTPDLSVLGSDPRTRTTVRLSFQPGSAHAVLIDVIGRRCCYRALFDGSDRTLLDFGDFFGEFAGFPRFAEWLDSDRILFVDRASAFVMGRDGSMLWDIESLHDAQPTAITAAGGVVTVGYDDGRVTTVSPDDRRMGTARSVHPQPVHDIAISVDGSRAVSSASDGSAVRFDVEPNVLASPTDELMVRSRRPIPVAMGRVRSDFVVMGVDERVELRTVDLGAAGGFIRRSNVSGAPTSSGALLVATPTGHELTAPEGTVRVHGEAGRTVVSDDGTTFLLAGSPPRIGRTDSSDRVVLLDVLEAVGFGPALALSSDGAIAAVEVGLAERSIRTFDGRTGGVLHTIEIEPLPSGSFVYLEQLLVSDHVVAFTRVDSGQPTSPRADGFEVRTEIHSTNGGWRRTIVGRSLLSVTSGAGGVVYVGGGNDGLIMGHPVDGGEPFEVLDVGLGDVVTAIATELHGGPLMAVGYESGRVELWNVETGGLIVELARHHTPVKALAVGQTVAGFRVSSVAHFGGPGGVGDGIVRTLDDPTLLRAALCALAGRDVSQAEWHRFVGVSDPLPCARGL